MKYSLVILLFLVFTYTAHSQRDSVLRVILIKTFSFPIKDFTTDNLGNIYLLTATNQIKKINDKGDSIAVYNDVKRYGRIYSIDAGNPLKVLVYYKDFSTIIVLDRLLNIRNTIDLRKQNIFQVKAITGSYDNKIWLYDELDSKIKKIDDNGRLLLESNDFRQVYEVVPNPVSIYDRDGQLYLYDTKKGLLVFDHYGARKNSYPINDLSDVQVLDKNTITARDSSHIVLYKPSNLQLLIFNAFKQQHNFSKINFNGKQIFCLTGDGFLSVYSTQDLQP